MIRMRSNSRLCFVSPSNRTTSASALADLASSLLRAFCRCFLVMVSGAGAAGACDEEVDDVDVVCEGPNFFKSRVGENAKMRGEKNIITGTVSTLDDTPFPFVFLIGVMDEKALFDDISIVIP